MNCKSIFLLIIISLSLAKNVNAQSTIDIAESNTLIRLNVTANSENKYLLVLKPLIKNKFNSLEDKSFEMIEFSKEKFDVVTREMIAQLWEDEYKEIEKDSATSQEDFDKQNEGINNENLKIDIIKNRIHESLMLNYDKIKLQLEQGKLYKALNEDNELSQPLQLQYDTYLKKLSSIQSKIAMLKRVRHAYYYNDLCNNQEKKYDLSANPINEKAGGNNPTHTPVHIQSVDEKEKEMDEYIVQSANNVKQIDNDLDELLLKENLFKHELNRIDNQRHFNVHLIGDANVVSSFRDNSKSSNINGGFGLIANKAGFTEFIGIITVAQAFEDTTSDYGSSILVPGVRRFSLLTRYRTYSMFKYHKHDFISRIGFAIDVNVTPYKWIKDSGQSIKVIPIAINLMFPYTWVHQSKEGQDYAISTDIGLSLRSIAGAASNEQVKSYLGVNSLPSFRTYVGPVIGLNIKYNALRVQFHAPILISSNENRIQGLTNGQVYASIGIIANLTNDLSKVIKSNED